MKLCPFCAEEIQDAAIKCKHCHSELPKVSAVPVPAEPHVPIFGSPTPKQHVAGTVKARSNGWKAAVILLGIAAGIYIVVMVFLLDRPSTAGNAPTKAATPTLDKSAAMQAERRRIMDGLIREGYFTEIIRNGNAMPRVWVTPKFTQGDFKDKERVLGAVYGFYFDGSGEYDSVALIDSITGKEIGRFSKRGLH